MGALASRIKDLGAPTAEIHRFFALPAPTQREKRPARPPALLARAVPRPFRLVGGTGGSGNGDGAVTVRAIAGAHGKAEFRAAARPENAG